jgi:hypothetical protein
LTVASSGSTTQFKAKAIELPELASHPVAEDTVISTKVVAVVEVGLDKPREVLVAKAVEIGADRMMVDMDLKVISTLHTAAAVEEDMEEQPEEATVVVMVSNLESMEADTIHQIKAAVTASKAKVVDTISRLRAVDTASHHRGTTRTDNKVAMILSLVLEASAHPSTSFLLEIPPIIPLVVAN